MSLSRYLENISRHYNSLDVLKKTHLQIQKDLGLELSEFVFKGDANTAYDELIEYTKIIIENIIKLHGEHFYSIMYRADVSEESISRIIKDGLDVNKNISKLFVDRELAKVLTREFYKVESNR